MSATSSGVQPQRADQESQAAQDQKRIVVVDDDQQLADLMREFLLEEGYAVEVCSQGDQAFNFIRTLLPNLIILDVRMAEIGGLGVLYLLSTDPQTREIPVLMCTAVSAGEMEPWQEVLDQKGVPILYKPFELAQLVAQVEAMI
jgi:DNA-binding response OmpR family regulator